MHCIGVDVGKQELVTYDGEKERIFPNDPKLSQFRRFIEATSDPLIVFEPTSSSSRRLETFCRTEKIACCQLNPRVVPHFRQVGRGRSKTDKTDAELLHRYGIERGHAEAVQLTHDALAQAVATHLACYRVVQKARVAYQGLVEALMQDPATSKILLRGLLREIRELKKKEALHLTHAQAVVATDEDAARRLEAVLTIPGIGPITALTLQTLFRKTPQADRRQSVALAGLDPIQYRSGTSVHRKTRISKRGNREVRKRLFEATLSAARFNPTIRVMYERLKEEGKPDKVARVAVARKLLLIAHAIYKTGEPFSSPALKEA